MDPAGQLTMSKTFKSRSLAARSPRLASFSFPGQSSVVTRHSSCALRLGLLLSTFGIAVAFSFAYSHAARAEPVATRPPDGITTTEHTSAFVDEASLRFAIPASWIRAVMQAESGGDARAISAQGAMGLMQIMPETWRELRLRYGLGTDPYDPRDNITAGAAYLREMHDRYGEPGFLAAYNAGPDRYQEHVATGRPLPAETVAYMAVVASLIDRLRGNGASVDVSAALSWKSSPLFVVRANAGSRASNPLPSASAQPRPPGQTVQTRDALRPQAEGLFVSWPRGNASR
jgi:hypothetical protein